MSETPESFADWKQQMGTALESLLSSQLRLRARVNAIRAVLAPDDPEILAQVLAEERRLMDRYLRELEDSDPGLAARLDIRDAEDFEMPGENPDPPDPHPSG